jgi:hypothetical protein
MLVDFDQLNEAPQLVVANICAFLKIDPTYFDNFNYFRANKTFQSKHHLFHKMGMLANKTLEPFFRKRPLLKRKLVSAYQSINSVETISGTELSEQSIEALQTFYLSDYKSISKHFLQQNRKLSWRYFND